MNIVTELLSQSSRFCFFHYLLFLYTCYPQEKTNLKVGWDWYAGDADTCSPKELQYCTNRRTRISAEKRHAVGPTQRPKSRCTDARAAGQSHQTMVARRPGAAPPRPSPQHASLLPPPTAPRSPCAVSVAKQQQTAKQRNAAPTCHSGLLLILNPVRQRHCVHNNDAQHLIA